MGLIKTFTSLLAGVAEPTEDIGFDLVNANLVFDGNSLVYGGGSTNPTVTSFPARISVDSVIISNSAFITNKGVNGQTTLQMSADAVTDIDPLIVSDVTNMLFALEILNDLFNNGPTAVYDNFVSYCQARKTAGWRVAVITNPSAYVGSWGYGTVSDFQEAFDSINEQIRTNYLTFADDIIDLRANPNFATYNTTYFNGDQTHLNDAGYQLVADIITSYLVTL